jgi:hypothetical protein
VSLSDHTQPVPHDPATARPAPDPVGVQPLASQVHSSQPVEIVPRGILFSLAAIPLGIAASVLIWKLGFVASISSFLMAGAAAFLYVRGARTTPRKGMVPLVAVILVGVAASFFAIVASDLVDAYGTPAAQEAGYDSVVSFVSANLFYGPVLKEYTTDLVMFLVFAALGVFGTMRRLLGARKGF